ncbi:MSHA biogenesis protein MshK [Vibrio sp. SCSIO 43145]|nr:MSHA biogenesis protein MshK [Vibrio sp. SCSIO 43186]USD45907.1 MSHA biogenesis protein MshK [Vibrio sp. SCSIO 43145]USD71113.1 MSHA biogenesis protein MshK [Vibrio sp. SCSIO 43139]
MVILMAYSSILLASQDPTAPLGWQKPQEAKPASKITDQPVPMLQSIVCREIAQCQAVLNNQVALVGETVNGYTVSYIGPELVTLVKAGKQWKLELFTLDIKQ